jgi:4'-phosphopantetheinyl transferase
MTSPFAYPLRMESEGAALDAGIGFAFCCDEEAEGSRAATFLHPSEELLWRSLRYPLRQANYILGRRAAKAALGICFPTVRPADIEIAHGVFGQPILRGTGIAGEVSLAHSHGAAVGVACTEGHPIGVDVEWIDPERAAAVQTCVTPEETVFWERAEMAPLEASFVSWSAREALGKALRCGLTVPFHLLALDGVAAELGSYRASFRNFPQYSAWCWVIGGYALSIVIPKRSSLRFSPPDEVRKSLAAAASRSAASPVNLRPG